MVSTRKRLLGFSLRLVIPIAVLLSVSILPPLIKHHTEVELLLEEQVLIEPILNAPVPVPVPVVSSAHDSVHRDGGSSHQHTYTSTPPQLQQGNHYLHLSLNETIRILKDLGGHDRYDGGELRCHTSPDAYYREPELYWYDYRHSSSRGASHNTNSSNATRRLLIAQSAAFGTYSQLLDLTSPINKAYARRWKHTMLIVQGTLVVLQEEIKTNCTPPEHRSTHNKMQLLKLATLRLGDHFDYLLILDADAMIYDFSVDVSDLMPPRAMVAANRVIAKKGVKKRATWKINAGVTLWNLHHPYTKDVVDGWTKAAVGFMNGRNNNQGDQLFLYHVLKSNASVEANVYSLGKEFNYNKATVIKHVKRPEITYEIGHTALDSRSEMIHKFTEEICQKFPEDCQNLDKTIYSQK